MRATLVSLAVILASATAFASSPVLPDACGASDVKFDVKTLADQPYPAIPDGKALIVFIEGKAGGETLRGGIDGQWVGAAKPDSYFAVPVDPGEHHLCYSLRGAAGTAGAASVTAEAGKAYYFQYEMHKSMKAAPEKTFTALPEDQGKYLTKKNKLAISTPK